MIGVERVDYVRVPVTDIDAANHFYGELLGLRRNPNSPADDWVEYEAGNVTLAVMTPHTHEYEFAALQGKMYEYACHEGNYAMPGILEGARVMEAREAAEAAKKAKPAKGGQ